MVHDDAERRVVALIKWGKAEYLSSLAAGELYLNTPLYYQENADKAFGDRFESCAYSYREGRDRRAPELRVDGLPLKDLKLTSANIFTATDRYYYLHCWSMISAWRSADELNSLLEDLQRQRQERGPCFVALRARDIETLLARIQAVETDAHCSHVEYSPDPNRHGCVCKRQQFSWEREFRFLVGECDKKETEARVLQLGDLSDLLLLNGALDLLNGDTKLTIDGRGIRAADLQEIE